MAPNLLEKSAALFLDEIEATSAEPVQIISKPTVEYTYTRTATYPTRRPSEQPQYRWQIAWKNIFAFIYLHIFGIWGMYQFFFVCSWKTFFWTIFLPVVSGLGVTAGAHRLWAHRSYKAKLPLRIILAIMHTITVQNDLYEWVRDHRVHHKFTDTDADPHNAKRGFFFSHIGWLMIRKHKDVINKGKTVDMSDLEADSVVRFQRKYYMLLVPFVSFLMPAAVPWYFWGEQFLVAWHVSTIFRYALSLHCTWLVNSAAHIWGTRPYDKNIGPTENPHVAFLSFGEGWHNYHHVFPWDYKAAELGNHLNPTTSVINFFAKIGWASDLKTVSVDMIMKRAKRTGDGTHRLEDGNNHFNDIGHNLDPREMVWGWGDKDMNEEDVREAKHFNKLE